VARLVELHMRFYGYRESGWAGSAGGPLGGRGVFWARGRKNPTA